MAKPPNIKRNHTIATRDGIEVVVRHVQGGHILDLVIDLRPEHDRPGDLTKVCVQLNRDEARAVAEELLDLSDRLSDPPPDPEELMRRTP